MVLASRTGRRNAGAGTPAMQEGRSRRKRERPSGLRGIGVRDQEVRDQGSGIRTGIETTEADRRDQTTGAGNVGYSTPETYWTTRMTWQE